MVEKKEWFRSSSSKEGKIYSCMWVGKQQRAILQIAHGMAEHSGRYDAFATYMAEHGYVVCMEDHAGHGKSAAVKGHFADQDGWNSILRDMKCLMDEVGELYPNLPVFLLGHSMGSFLTRCYITRYGETLSGCILSSTMGPFGGVVFGKMAASLQIAFRGKKSPGKFLDKLGSNGYLKRIQNPVNKFAWLSTVEEECIKYEKDPDCGFEFTAGGYLDMYRGLTEVNSKKWSQAVPQNLPVYLIAGTEDPVGNYGKGPEIVHTRLKETNHKTELKLYPGKRHELFNEDNRMEVYEDVKNWLDKHII